MNITNFIVEVLKSGKTVEVNGIGTFSTQKAAAYHDAEKGVFYPDRITAAFSNETVGDDSVIDLIAKRECVSRDIAEKMWQSYIFALKEKLQQQGSHTFIGFGTLVSCADGYTFKADPALNLSGDGGHPIKDVHQYANNDVNPFDAFDSNMQAVDNPMDVPTKPEVEFVPNVDANQPQQPSEPEPIQQPVEPEPEVVQKPVEPEPEVVQQPVEPEPEVVQQPEEQEPEQDTPSTHSVDDQSTLDVLDSIPDSDGNNVSTTTAGTAPRKKRTGLWILLAILLLLLGLCAYGYFVYMPKHGGTPESALKALKSQIASIRGEGSDFVGEDADEMNSNEGEQQEFDDLFVDESINENDMDASGDMGIVSTEIEPTIDETEDAQIVAEQEERESDSETTTSELSAIDEEPSEVVVANEDSEKGKLIIENIDLPFTLSSNLIVYDQRDIANGTRTICRNINDYVNTFLASRRYTNARNSMMDRVKAYAERRLGEMYDPDQFYVERLVQQEDYIHDYLYDVLKQRRENKTCVAIQSELMDYNMLDQMLNDMVSELGLQADQARPVAAEPKVNEVKKEIPDAHFEKASKQGYDIVAGFYTNKSTANRMAAILKRQGCDAYIIDKNGLFYVSMGSAPTQTAAEALFNHIKSWYDGDIAIRKL